jgi:hypothetical protein
MGVQGGSSRSRPSELVGAMYRHAGNYSRISVRPEVRLPAGLVSNGLPGDAARMAAKTVARNVYDPRVRELVRATGNPELFPDLNIPRGSTPAYSGMR